ncbi:YbhB/YbcL family Raf kinase inhibitor-like protein [Chloroflexota bacterium]
MLKSPAFKDNGLIPKKYTADGEKISPPLQWDAPPAGTKSFALLMEDMDVPEEYGSMFIHWMVVEIPANARGFEEGKLPAGAKYIPNMFSAMGMTELTNYGPPWPPSSAHRYKFTLYAIGKESLGLAADAGYEGFTRAVGANTIDSWSLTGVYGPAETPLPTG